MRALIEKEKPPRDLWDIKLIPGGLIDLEFIAQVAVITGQVEAGRRADRDRPKSCRGWRRISPTPTSGKSFAKPTSSIWR